MIYGLDLFTGIGGITLALSDYVRPVCYCEIEPYAQSVLKTRIKAGDLPDAPIWDDVRTLDGHQFRGVVDIITAPFPARILALQERARDWKESAADFFSRSCAWPKKSSPALYSLKTCQQSEHEDSTLLGKNWPISAMIVDMVLYPLTTWERRIKEKDGFCLPTPDATDAARGPTKTFNPKAKSQSGRTLTTLAVRDPEGILWPTPRASEYKDCGPVGSKSQIHMDKRDYLCAKAKDPSSPTGKLSPMWVEWLMGYRQGWTELDVSEMQLFPRKFAKLLKD